MVSRRAARCGARKSDEFLSPPSRKSGDALGSCLHVALSSSPAKQGQYTTVRHGRTTTKQILYLTWGTLQRYYAYLHEWMFKIGALSCKEAMKNLYNLVIEYFSKDKRLRFWRAITFIPNQQLNSLFAQLISEKDAIFKQKMQRCFLKGQSKGEIRPDVSLGSLRLYLCMIQGVLDGMLLYPEELRYKDNAAELFEAYWDGICTSRAN